ncbi:uncharacterized protein LOC120330675 [Styela clava]
MKVPIACFLVLMVAVGKSKGKRNRLVVPEPLPEEEFCLISCKGACYYQIQRTVPLQWPGADGECDNLREGGHLANIYNRRCYNDIREALIKRKSRGQFLIGMKYQQELSNLGDKLNLYNSEDRVKNPRWYRNRPNRIGQKEIVLIIGQKPKLSGLRNVLDGGLHQKILCQVEK